MTFAAALATEARRLRRALRILGHVALGLIVADTVLAVLAQVRDKRAHRWRMRLMRWWSHGVCRILDVRISVCGQINPAPTLYVANHVSWLDIPCLHAVAEAGFVAKQDVAGWPIIGRMARRAGTLFIKRGESNAAALAAEQMTWALMRAHSMIIFPEGTTTDGRRVNPFHARLYQPAIRTHTPVQSVAIQYVHADGVHPAAPFINDDNLVRHLWCLLREEDIQVRLTFGAPITPGATMRRRELAHATRAQIFAALTSALPEPAQENLVMR